MKLSVLKNNQPEFDYETPTLSENDTFEIYIGRSDDCHIQLDNHLISRHHGLISLRSGKWLLEVLSDFGGVTVNGSNIDKHNLMAGDRIVIDDYVLNVSDINFEDHTQQMNDPLAPESAPSSDKTLQTKTDIIDENPIENEVASIEENIQDDEIDSQSNDSMFDDEDDSVDESPMSSFEDEDAAPEENMDSEDSQGGFGDNEGFGDDEMSDDMGGGFTDEGSTGSESTRVLSGFANYELIISGEHAQYDRFTIDENEVLIGRDAEKCDIFLNDPEVSTEHAKIKKTLISVTLIDLGSSNGTILNGSRINQQELTNGDVFTIGSTKFEVAIVSDLIDAEQDYLMPIEDGQEITVEEIIEEEVDFDDLQEGEDENYAVEGLAEEKSIFKNPQKRKNLIYGVVGLLLVFALMEDEEKPVEKKDSKKPVVEVVKPGDENKQNKKKYSEDQLTEMQASYTLARQYFMDGAYSEAELEIEKVSSIDPSFKETQLVKSQIKTALARLEEERRRQREEQERKERDAKIRIRLTRAKEEVKNKEMASAKAIIAEILKLDPENIEVPQLKLEIDAYETEERLKREALDLKKAERSKMVDQKKPGDLAFSKQEWYPAITHYEKYISIKGIDEDLIALASENLKIARENLKNQLNPMLGRARSLKEAQDLKSSYEEYKKILDLNPRLEEALIEMEEIRITLENRSKSVFREALISESLSLFQEAKEKFKEVQQISPSDSIYYEKATRKLKEYLE